ncbi:MAG: hypothetical protein AB2L26_09600 [Ignavibacteria bacterium]
MDNYYNDVNIISASISSIPHKWEGKECVLELKEADYQWRQMEWWAFYFEFKVKNLLGKTNIEIPGDRIGNVVFDLKGSINWDLKASAVKTDNHKIILNDKEAMDISVERDGSHGEIIALCDVEYNDVDRKFQKWHTELKEGKSKYEVEREKRTSVSRYRKTSAELIEILFVIFKKEDLDYLSIMKQGRNSNGSPRKVKYLVDLEQINPFLVKTMKIS